MRKSKKWEIVSKSKIKNPAKGEARHGRQTLKIEDIITLLLENRNIKTKKDREQFLHPDLGTVTIDSVGIDKKQLKRAISRVKEAFEKNEQIIVFGDYDVDGIAGSAVLWEALHSLGLTVLPYIPHRIDEGYGLSIKGIENLLREKPRTKLIITVDNGIVANEAVEYAASKGIDVIITDHHMPHSDENHVLPDAYAIIHTTKLCGAAVAYLFSKEIKNSLSAAASGAKQSDQKRSPRQLKTPRNDTGDDDNHLELVALATIADMVPLTHENRTLAYFGIQKLRETKREGLLALFDEASIDPQTITSYHVGHMIAPRLNAAGRLESAMDSLRLLCTNNKIRAGVLARSLGRINKERQNLLTASAVSAIEKLRVHSMQKKILIIAHEEYQEGVIGLIAGRIVEEYYRPAIVISKRDTHSKASVRSVHGFNIIEFLRKHTEYFVNIGGHPMAAGFTIETTKIRKLSEVLEKASEEVITEDMLSRSIKIDSELDLSYISDELYKEIQKLQPFGVGNPEPVFLSEDVEIEDMRVIGKDGKHLKMKISDKKKGESEKRFDVIAFGMGERSQEISIGDRVDIVYSIDENVWNGRRNLQLKLRDFILSN